MKKIFKKLLIASVAASSFIFSPPLDGTNFFPTVQAEIKTYIGVGKGTQSELVTAAKAKEYARLRAEINAKDQAGVYLRGYTKMQNFNLTENKIEVITNSIVNIVGEVNYTQKPFDLDGVPVVVYTATLQANIDTDGINAYINREDKAEFQSMRREIIETLNKIDNLIERYNRATTQEEKDKIRAELTQTDRELLAVQKIDEGNKFLDQGKYQESIKAFNESLKFSPNHPICLFNLAGVYYICQKYDKAIDVYNELIDIVPDVPMWQYDSRGKCYEELNQYDNAIADYTKEIELIENECLEFNVVPYSYYVYINRGKLYTKIKKYHKALKDFEQSIELLNKEIEINKIGIWKYQTLSESYYNRGLTYKALGETEKANADFAKAKELQQKNKN